MFFIKRKKESSFKRNRSQLGPALRILSGPYYMAKISRPGTTKFANDSKCLKPAWDQAMISSKTLPTISSTVWLRRSKVLSFLSFHISQQMSTTRESNPRRQTLGISFRACAHQSRMKSDWVCCRTRSYPNWCKTWNHTSREKGDDSNRL